MFSFSRKVKIEDEFIEWDDYSEMLRSKETDSFKKRLARESELNSIEEDFLS